MALIYKADNATFLKDIRENRLTSLMADAFKASFVREVGTSEENSWRNSLPKIKDLIEIADLKDINIALEYEIPYNQSRDGNGVKNGNEEMGSATISSERKVFGRSARILSINPKTKSKIYGNQKMIE